MQCGGHQEPVAGAALAIREPDCRQGVARGIERDDGSFVDRNPGAVEQADLVVIELGGTIGEQGDVGAPLAQQEGTNQTRLASIEHAQELVAHLPTVAEGAVEHRPPPERLDAGHIGPAVLHTGGQQDTDGVLAGPVGEVEHEPATVSTSADDRPVAHRDGGVGLELGPTRRVQLSGRSTVVAEQAADPVRGQIGLSAGIDHEGALPGPPQHERCAQPCGSGSNDDAIPGVFHGRHHDDRRKVWQPRLP